MIFKAGKTCVVCLVRCASTDAHALAGLHPWPTNATPLGLFKLDLLQLHMPDKEMKPRLKEMYTRYVKLYHPDVNRSKVIVDYRGRILSSAQKDARFMQVQSAYDILKTPHRRHAYHRYSSSSNAQTESQKGFMRRQERPFSDDNFRRFQQANANRWTHDFARNESFWQAKNWDDYYRAHYNKRPPTVEELNKNKTKILLVVIAIGAMAFALQVLAALDASASRRKELEKEFQKSAFDLEQSRINYGYGGGRADRLERFLMMRRLVMPEEEEEKEDDKD